MKNTIITLLGTLMILLAFSSCDETELIDPQDERVTLNRGAGNGTVDGDDNSFDGTYTLDEEETVGVRTRAGYTAVSDLDVDAVDTRRVSTTIELNDGVANDDNTTTNTIRTSYSSDRAALTADPVDPVDTRQSYYSSGGTWDHKRPKENDRVLSTQGTDATDNRTPVMPEYVEARSLRSVSSSMK